VAAKHAQDGELLLPVGEEVRHHAAAAVAIGLGAEHALLLDLAASGEGEALLRERAVIGDPSRPAGLHELQDTLRDRDEVAALRALELEQPLDHLVAPRKSDPELVGDPSTGV
jgi:hypothetical protein